MKAIAFALSLHVALGRPLYDSTLGLCQVDWLSEKPNIFLGSPSILRLSSTDLLATADRFGHGFASRRNVSVYRSQNNGTDWDFVGWALDQYWSNLFMHAGNVYLLGTSSDGPAPIKIQKSSDGGLTWPGDAPHSAILFGGLRGNLSFETGPTPTLLASNGRLYRAMERLAPPFNWGKDYEAAVVHANGDESVGGSLLDPKSWTLSATLPFNKSWIPKDWPELENPGFLEGNMVEGPDGTIYNVLRFNSRPVGNKAVLLRFDVKTNAFAFDSIIDLPGGHTKFVIRRDEQSGVYYTLSNPNDNPKYEDQRNILALCSSLDLRTWYRGPSLLEDDTGFSSDDSAKYTGFHYVDWQFDGEDIIYLTRTSYRGAVSYHNSNRITFKKLSHFRQYKPQPPKPLTPAKLGAIGGQGWSSAQLKNGGLAYSNRAYTWQGVPTRLEKAGWNFTMGPGGGWNSVNITITAATTGDIFVTTFSSEDLSTDGWHRCAEYDLATLYYTDEENTMMSIWAKPVVASEVVVIRQEPLGRAPWAGVQLLIPPLDGVRSTFV